MPLTFVLGGRGAIVLAAAREDKEAAVMSKKFVMIWLGLFTRLIASGLRFLGCLTITLWYVCWHIGNWRSDILTFHLSEE
jgi:hypothetical protein